MSVAGCSGRSQDKYTRARPPLHRVTGTVSEKGAPLAGAKVTFKGRGGSIAGERDYMAYGWTDRNGRFTLTTFRDGDGAVAGPQRVTVEKIEREVLPLPPNFEPGMDPPTRTNSLLPARYRNFETSGLEAEVSANSRNDFTFVIE